jgi:membrane associated rhomboid family serine protease
MIFISDDENQDRDTPYVTYGLVCLVVCGLIASGLAFASPAVQKSIEGLTLQPALGPAFGTLLLGMKFKALGSALASLKIFTLFSGIFVHPNFLCMLWTAMLLWVFGDNVEYAMGAARFTFFFFLCGVLTAIIDALVTHTDPGVKIAFGPGGAVAAVAGAYAAYFPLARLKVEIHFGSRRHRRSSIVFGSRYGRGRTSTSFVLARNFIGFYFVLNLVCGIFLSGKGIQNVPYTMFPFWGQAAGMVMGYGLAFLLRDYNVLFTLDEEKQEYKLPPRKPKPAYDPFAPDEPKPDAPPPPPQDDSKTF